MLESQTAHRFDFVLDPRNRGWSSAFLLLRGWRGARMRRRAELLQGSLGGGRSGRRRRARLRRGRGRRERGRRARPERRRDVPGAGCEQQREREETSGRSNEGGAGPPPGPGHRRGINTLAVAATIAATEQTIDAQSSVKESR